MGVVICMRRTSRYLERKHFGRLGGRDIRICNSRRIFGRLEERVWWRR